MFRKILSVFTLVLMMGCATPRQWVSPIEGNGSMVDTCPQEKACVYVIRPASIGGLMHFIVKDNDVMIGETGPQSYLAWQRDPGYLEISSLSENTANLGGFEAQAGKSYYVLQSVKMGILTARSSLALISKEQAQEYMKKCRKADYKKK